MCAWAENHGALAAVLCEHHGSEDGYLPSPLILASAIAARTERLALSLILLLPFYDAVRLAEDMAVLDIISKGRASYILALGYRPEEFEHFGVDMRTRGRLADEKLALLRELLSGEAVFEGRRINTTPPPHTAGGPMLMWGGGTVAAARRAGRYGLGMLGNANVDGMQEAYEEACREHGHEPGPMFLPDRDTPSVCFVADDVDKAWDELGQYLLHDVRTYAAWNPGNDDVGGLLRRGHRRRTARASPSHTGSTASRKPSSGCARARCSTCRRCAAGVPPGDRLALPEARRRGRHVRGSAVTGASAVEVYYDPYDFEIDDDPVPDLEAAARRSSAVLQREVQLLRAEPVRGRRARAAELGDLPVGSRHHDGHHHERHRGSARRHPVRGSRRYTTFTAVCSQGFSRRGGWRRSSR